MRRFLTGVLNTLNSSVVFLLLLVSPSLERLMELSHNYQLILLDSRAQG